MRSLTRLEVDQHAAGVEGGVGAVDADEAGQAVDVRVLEHGGAPPAAGGRAMRRRTPTAAPGDALDEAGVLGREQALGDDDVEQRR